MLQMLLAAGSAAAIAWLLFSKKKADESATKEEKQCEKTTDEAAVAKPSTEDNRVTAPVTSSELATALEKPSSVDNQVAQVVTSAEETKPVDALIVPVAPTQQVDQAPAAPITAEAPPDAPPQDVQQIQREVPVAPSPVQATPPAPIQEVPIAAPQLDLESPGELDALPASTIPVPQVLATPVFEAVPLPSASIEAPPPDPSTTELTPPLLAPPVSTPVELASPAPLPSVQAPSPVSIQEVPIAAPQHDLASPGNLDEVAVEMASPAPTIPVPQVLATPVFETVTLPPTNIETPPPVVTAPTELTPSLLASQDAQQIQREVPVAPSPVQAPSPAPIQEVPIAAPQLDLESPGELDAPPVVIAPVEMAPSAPAILVPQMLATPGLVTPVELAPQAPLPSVSEAPPPVVVASPLLSTASASNEAPPPPIAPLVDSAPVSPQHQPPAEKDSQDVLSSDHLIVPKPTADQGETVEQSPSSPASTLPPPSPAAASPEKDVGTALDIDTDMVPEPQVMTARETPTTPISTAKEVTDVETAVSPSQRM